MSVNALKESDRAAFRRAVRALNDTIVRVRRYIPEAQYYLDAGGGLNLLSGDHHEGRAADARRDRVLDEARISFADGGDW